MSIEPIGGTRPGGFGAADGRLRHCLRKFMVISASLVREIAFETMRHIYSSHPALVFSEEWLQLHIIIITGRPIQTRVLASLILRILGIIP